MGVTVFLLLSCLGFAITALEIVTPPESGIHCVEPDIEHGYVDDVRPPYRPNDKVTFECSTGYKIKGNPTLACQDDGNWSPPPPKYALAAIAYILNRSGVGARICRSLKNRRQKRHERNVTNTEQEEL